MQKTRLGIVMLLLAGFARGGELKKDYFGASMPKAWATYDVTFSGGGKSEQRTERLPDEEGRPVVAESIKIFTGPGAGADTRNVSTLPKDFSVARDWLSHGCVTEKMTMEFGAMKMPVDATTLKALRDNSKNFRGAVTFEAAEKIGDRMCDRYTYALPAGPDGSRETGTLWLEPETPFGIVRQTGRVLSPKGDETSSFDIRLRDLGAGYPPDAEVVKQPVEAPAAPAVVGFVEGYKAGRYSIDVTVVAGSKGRQLALTLKNKGDAPLTAKLPAGSVEVPADSPVGALRLMIAKAVEISVPAEATSAPVVVTQRSGRAPVEGTFNLSVYEGALLYSGSVTMGNVP